MKKTNYKNIFSGKFIQFAYFLPVVILLGYFSYLSFSAIESRSLEYDEIWTTSNYAQKSFSEIFTNVKTPNNHPLFSAFVKLSFLMFGESATSLRITAFASAIMSILLIGLTTYKLFANKIAAILTIFIFASNGAILHYAQTARGYSLQLLFCIMFGYLCVEYYNNGKEQNHPILIAAAMMLTATAGLLTLPTSIIFISLIFLCLISALLLREFNKFQIFLKNIYILISKHKSLILCNIIFYLFAFYWFISRLDQYREAQKFGQYIANIHSFGDFFINTNLKIFPFFLFLIPLIFLVYKKYRLTYLNWLFIFSGIYFSAIFTKAGPARTYIFLIPLSAPFIAFGIVYFFKKTLKYHNKHIKALTFILCLIMILTMPYNLDTWTPPDWPNIAVELEKKLPENCYINFPGGMGYPILCNKGIQIIKSSYSRIPKTKKPFILVQTGGKNLSVCSLNGNEKSFKLNTKAIKQMSYDNKVSISFYKLIPISPKSKATIIFASIVEKNKSNFNKLFSFISQSKTQKWYILNLWFSNRYYKSLNKKAVIVFSPNNKYSTEQLLEIEKKTKNKILFYNLETN